jgi:hypothetical protein
MLEGLCAPVIGPSTILPRGYLWLAPIWYAVAAVALIAGHWPPLWFRLTAAAGLLGAMLTLVLALSRLTIKAFSADSAGVRIGLPPTTRRRGRHRRQVRLLTWAQIERVRIARRPYGTRLEILLSPDATAAARPGNPGLFSKAGTWLLLLLIPLWYLRRPTGLASPLDRPPRYRVVLRDLTTDELGRAIRALAPPDVTVAVLVRKR